MKSDPRPLIAAIIALLGVIAGNFFDGHELAMRCFGFAIYLELATFAAAWKLRQAGR